MISFQSFILENLAKSGGYQRFFINFKYGLDDLLKESSYYKQFYIKGKEASHLGHKNWKGYNIGGVSVDKGTATGYDSVKTNALGLFKSIKDTKISTEIIPIQHDTKKKHRTKEVERGDKLDEELRKHYRWPNDEHIAQLKEYTNGSSAINKYLYEKSSPIFKGVEPHYNDKIKDLDEAMARNKTPKDIVVYSALKRSPEQLKEFHSISEGKHFRIHLPAFTSTTVTRAKMFSFGSKANIQSKYGNDKKHYITIRVPKGSHGAYVENLTSWPEEKEFILPRDSKIHVYSKPKVTSEGVYWYGHLVHDGYNPTRKYKTLQLNFFKKLLGKEEVNESFAKAWKYHWRQERKMGNPFAYKRLRWPMYAIMSSPPVGSAALAAGHLVHKNYEQAAIHGLNALALTATNALPLSTHIKDVLRIRKKLKQAEKNP